MKYYYYTSYTILILIYYYQNMFFFYYSRYRHFEGKFKWVAWPDTQCQYNNINRTEHMMRQRWHAISNVRKYTRWNTDVHERFAAPGYAKTWFECFWFSMRPCMLSNRDCKRVLRNATLFVKRQWLHDVVGKHDQW